MLVGGMLVTVDVYSSLSRKALAYFTATYGQSSHRLTEWQDTIDGAAHLSEKARALEATPISISTSGSLISNIGVSETTGRRRSK